MFALGVDVCVLTFEQEARVVFKCVVRLLHGDEARVHRLTLLTLPRLSDQLAAELQDQTEDAVDDVHHRSGFLRQQSPAR